MKFFPLGADDPAGLCLMKWRFGKAPAFPFLFGQRLFIPSVSDGKNLLLLHVQTHIVIFPLRLRHRSPLFTHTTASEPFPYLHTDVDSAIYNAYHELAGNKL